MIDNNKFELIIHRVDFKKGDIMNNVEGTSMKVLSTPTGHYSKWYWRILNLLTFKVFFNAKYTYTVKIIEDGDN